MPRPWLRLILLIGATILVAVNGATADDGDGDADYSRSGAYLRGGIGVAWISSSSSFPMAPSQSWVTNADVQLALGWRHSERLALEVEFEWVPSHDSIGNGILLP